MIATNRISVAGKVLVPIGAVIFWPAMIHGGTDVRVNPSDSPGTVQNEVSIAINTNPRPGANVPAGQVNLVIAHNDDPGIGTGLGVSFSKDSGATWTERTIGEVMTMGMPNRPITDPLGSGKSLTNIFDPITGSDTLGDLYAGYIATTNNRFEPSGVYIQMSTDGGDNWGNPIAVHSEPDQMFVPPMQTFRFNDKPHLAVDRFKLNAISMNNIYVAWVQDDAVNAPTDLRFSASSDGGTTWFPTPAFVNDNPGLTTDKSNGPNATVAANGAVYVAWLDVDVTDRTSNPKPATLYIDRSLDGGMTWGRDQIVVHPAPGMVNSLPDHLSTTGNQMLQDDARARGYPVIGVDPMDAAGQTVYLVYAAQGARMGDEADIFFTRSTNGGMQGSWTAPLRINDDSTNTDQFAPWMAVKPDGTIDVVWYDKRNSSNDDQWDVYVARSTDGGSSFSTNVRVSDLTFATTLSSGNEPWLGEYLGISVDSHFAYIGFTSRGPAPGDANGDIYFDKIANTSIPEPSALPVAVAGVTALLLRWRRAKATGQFRGYRPSSQDDSQGARCK